MSKSGGNPISAQYKRPSKPSESQRPARGRENVQWKRIKELSMQGQLDHALTVTKESASVIARWLLFKHLTPLEAEAARRYAFIMGRFDRFFTEGRRTAKSPSYERAYGEDQELERRALEGTIGVMEVSAKKARRNYERLQKYLANFRDPVTGRNQMKEALDQLCCEDIEPPAEYRKDIAAALRLIAHEFGVTVQNRRGRPRKNRGR